MGYSVSYQIQRFISESAIEEFFNKAMEYDMAYAFVEVRNNWIGMIYDIQETAKLYVERNERYEFKYHSAEEFFPMMDKYMKNGPYADAKGELLRFLRVNTGLDENNIEILVNKYTSRFN